MTEKHMYNLQCWQKRIQDRCASGMTVVEWCAANGVTKDAYYYWLSRLREESYEDAVTNLPCAPEPQQAFVEITRAMPSAKGTEDNGNRIPMATVRKGSLQIDIMSHSTQDFLRNLLEAVSHVQA